MRKRVGDLGPKDTTGESARDKLAFAKGFVDACRVATEQMGKDLKLAPVDKAAAVTTSAPSEVKPVITSMTAPAKSSAPVYDLRGVACPMNYVKTKTKARDDGGGRTVGGLLMRADPLRMCL